MTDFLAAYQHATHRPAPLDANRLAPLFAQIAADHLLPPRGQQAVNAGFTAHTLSDAHENPPIYHYYQWVLANCLAEHPVHELSAQLVGNSFVCVNLFQTDLPQPLTLNPWQVSAMADFPLMTNCAVMIENNGVFAWLHHRHPNWPLIDQAGNDFNSTANRLLQRLVHRGVAVTYLGDLDSPGIQIAERVQRLIPQVPADELFALQLPQRVFAWLVQYGKPDTKRTKQQTVQTPLLQEALTSIHTLGKFVEQEQLIAAYEDLISAWLAQHAPKLES